MIYCSDLCDAYVFWLCCQWQRYVNFECFYFSIFLHGKIKFRKNLETLVTTGMGITFVKVDNSEDTDVCACEAAYATEYEEESVLDHAPSETAVSDFVVGA